MLQYDIIPAEEGLLEIGSFLGDYFIRKAAWASKYSIQENISSFKKFYTFLVKIEKTDVEDLQKMHELIKEEKAYWLKNVDNYWNNIEDDW